MHRGAGRGELRAQGDVLVEMDTVQTRATYDALQYEWYSLKAQEARLIAEKNNAKELRFDPALLTSPEPDHFGLRVLADVAGAGGAGLELQTSPGHGTRWRLSLPASAVRSSGDPS